MRKHSIPPNTSSTLFPINIPAGGQKNFIASGRDILRIKKPNLIQTVATVQAGKPMAVDEDGISFCYAGRGTVFLYFAKD